MSLRKCLSLLVLGLVAGGCDPAPTTGSVVVTVEGLPPGSVASVRLTGPNEFAFSVPSTQTVEGLPPGEYVLWVDDVIFDGAIYQSPVAEETLDVRAGGSESVAVPYTLASGSLELTIAGLPAGAFANITLSGVNGFARSVQSSGVQRGLPPGAYTVEAGSALSAAGDVFAAEQAVQEVTVPLSLDPVGLTVSYSQESATLALTVAGLPSNVDFDPVLITGPNGFERGTSESVELHGLVPGAYTISASNVASFCPTMYTTATTLQSSDIGAGVSEAASVVYSQGTANPAELNLRIANAQLVQVTQDSAGNVPLVAGRPALLRIFALANQCNTATPGVRVTLSNGSVTNIPAAEAEVRTLVSAGVLGSTWNLTIPDTAVRPGLTFVAEVDPDGAVSETNEGDNRYPATGTASADVRSIPPVGLRFVPIAFAGHAASDIGPANVEQYMAFSRTLHPVDSFDINFHDVYTTQREPVSANDGNAWSGLLSELEAVRQNEGSDRLYHGIVPVDYNSGIAGIAFVGGSSGLSWHHLPSASGVLAHELGHNYGQLHAPCGGPAGPDPNYPYPGGTIGQYGYDPATQTLKAPRSYTDVMGYCNAQWISDYMYRRMLNNLQGRTTLPFVASAEEPVLLVWGRISNGSVVLEPAFQFTGRAQPPTAGPYRLAALAADGSTALEISFAARRVADIPGDNEIFAFTIPVSALGGRDVESLRLTARGRTVRNRVSADVGADADLRVTRTGPRTARLRWNAARFPVVMVRDPASGHVLSIARGGDATIVTQRAELEVSASNRVRSARRMLHVSR